ncbi:hypothetical protein SAMN04487981_106116 [Streptomyces sp. cf386]|nr:hypothetical protein [Streptomyces sp. cf386]SDN66682.1 hypothetical protein SAMN04487981_106116 [Streptomyces sp. cf386]
MKWPRVHASPFAEPGADTPFAGTLSGALFVLALACAITLHSVGRKR